MNLYPAVLRCSLLVVSLVGPFIPSSRGQLRPRVTEAVDEAQRVTLRGNVHPLARAEFDRGAVAEAQPMKRILLLLKRSDEQEAALQTTLQNLQDKSSPHYHQWLSPQQFGAQFGPTDADVQAVTDWLTRQGFTIEKVYSGKTVVEFSGTAGQVQKAFGTAIHSYQVNGKTYSANSSDPQIPAALAPVVTGVVSLHSFPRQFYSRRVGTIRRADGKNLFESLDPLVTITYQGTAGLGPGDFAKIYGTPATCGTPAAKCNGAGQIIAIVGETNFNVGDVQQFRSIFGLPATFDGTNIVYNGEDPGITSTDEEAEALLDTEWSGGVAPGATIKFVLSASTSGSQGVDLSALYIVEHNLAAVMSESYGSCESNLGAAENSFVNNLWQQASAQGITVAVSTGDSGSAGCDDPNSEGIATHGPAVNGLASTVYNVGVGGTDFDEYGRINTYWKTTNDSTTGTSAIGYIPEIPWNQSCAQLGASGCNVNTTPTYLQNIVGGGGGPSNQYNRPSWQMAVTGSPSGDGKRDLPDVSLLASPGFNGTGYLYCQSDFAQTECNVSAGFAGPNLYFGEIGGTSASAPAFAGVMAMVNQSQATTQNPTPRQGNANYILYALANKAGAYGANCASNKPPASTCVFNDVISGSTALPGGGSAVAGTNSVPCQKSITSCHTVTGSGSQIGVFETTSTPPVLDWTAGAGYDMATGLGTLNIGNLISNWGSVSSVATTTTLTLNPTTGIKHGSENVTATIAVTPTSGTASGTVSLIATPTAGAQIGAGQFTLGTNGSVTGTVQNLPGGTGYQVYAHYSGDGTNAPSDSTPVAVTVAQESSKTFIVVPTFNPTTGNETGGNASSVAYGSSYIVRVYVTNSGGAANPSGAPTGACSRSSSVACPSGTVSLTANGNAVDGGTFQLDNIGYTRDIAPTLPGGTYPLAAAYSGDSNYASSSASESFTVTPAPTTITAVNGPIDVLVGQTAPLSTWMTSSALTGVAPTGTITFYDGNTALTAPVTLSVTPPTGTSEGQIYAQTNPAFTTTGTHTITAKYSGDGNYAAAASPGNTPISVLYATSMSLTLSQNTVTYGQSVTLTAVLTSHGKTPPITGQIGFFSGGSTFTNITNTVSTDGNGNQTITATATTVPPGSVTYSASYSGDTNYESASMDASVNVNIPDFTLGPQSGLSVIAASGQASSGQITVTPVSQTPSTVVLQLASVPNIAGYTISLSSQQVNLSGAAVQTTLNLTPISGASGTAVRAQVRKAGFVALSRENCWALSFACGLAVLFVLGSAQRRRKLRSTFGLGAICLFCFLGCGGGGGSGGGGGGVGGGGGGGGVTQNATNVTLTSSNPKVSQNGQLTLTATVTGGKNLSGYITFYDYGSAVAGAFSVTDANPSIEIGTGDLFVGVHQITAKFSGDAQNLPSTSAAVTQTITGTTAATIQGATGSDVHTIQVTLGLQ